MRSAVSPALPTSRPRSRQAAIDLGRGRGRARRRAGGPSPRTSVTPASALEPGRELRAACATQVSSSSSSSSQTAQAAAQATGLPPKVRRGRRARSPRGASSPTSRRRSGGRWRGPWRASRASGCDAGAAPRRRRCRSGRRRSAPRRRRAARRARRRARGRPRGRRAQRTDAALALSTGSSRIAAVSPSTAARERLGVVRRDEADARDERLEAAPLRGLAGDRERAERAAVERALERDEGRARRSPCART